MANKAKSIPTPEINPNSENPLKSATINTNNAAAVVNALTIMASPVVSWVVNMACSTSRPSERSSIYRA